MTDQQIERIEDILFELMEDPIGVDEIQATFAAIAAGPGIIKPSVWLPFLFEEEGGAVPVYESESYAEELIKLLMDLYNETIENINNETFDPFFRYYEDDEDEALDPEPWCRTFHLALELHAENIISEGDEELLTMLLPVVYFFDPDAVYKDMKAHNETLSLSQDEVREEMMDLLADVVYNVRDHFNPEQNTGSSVREGRLLPFEPPNLN